MAGRGVNKVILIGNLGNEPEVRYMPSGDPMAQLSIATNEVWRDKNTGEQQKRTEWHRVVIFGKTAEVAKQYLHKGSTVYIEGKLRTRKWQGQDGQDRYTTEVVVAGYDGSMQMLDSRGAGGATADFETGAQVSGMQPQHAQARPDPAAGSAAAPPNPAYNATQGSVDAPAGAGNDFDDDIPF